MANFNNLLVPELVDRLQGAGITAPNSLQEEILPLALSGRSINCVAQTGSGKTLILLLPVLQWLSQSPVPDPTAAIISQAVRPEAILLVPTRELALQHARWAQKLAGPTLDRLLLRTLPQLLAELDQNVVRLDQLRMVAIDEIDSTLFEGEPWSPQLTSSATTLLAALEGASDVQYITATAYLSLAQERVLGGLFDATRVPVNSSAAGAQGVLPPTLEQRFHYFNPRTTPAPIKLRNLLRASHKVQQPGRGPSIVFCQEPQNLCSVLLEQQEVEAVWLGTDRAETEVQAAVSQFMDGIATVLVCCVAAGRGLDFPACRHVVLYDLPAVCVHEAAFVHCAGRTARGGRRGVVDCMVPSGGTIGKHQHLHALQAAEPIQYRTAKPSSR